jgi:hypothetical protein
MVRRIDDQFMLGDRLLVAPVLKAGQRSRSVYLPTPLEGSGVWKRETDGTFFEGGQWLHNSRLGRPPLHGDKKEKIKFSSYRRKFRMEHPQSCMTNGLLIYEEIFAHFFIYSIRKPFLIYDFATAPF